MADVIMIAVAVVNVASFVLVWADPLKVFGRRDEIIRGTRIED